MATSRHTAQHRHAHPKHLRFARQHLASIKVYLFRNAVSHIAVATGSPVFFTKPSFTQAFVLSKHLQNQLLPFRQGYWSIYWSTYWSIYWVIYWVIFAYGVAHKSLLHSRLTISRVTVSTTLKTPNSLTLRKLHSTTPAASRLTVAGCRVLPDGYGKRGHTLYDWNSSDNFTINSRHNPENAINHRQNIADSRQSH